MPGILITSGDSHSADQWAVVTAEHIWPINPAVEGDRLMAARKIQNAIVDLLVPHFQSQIASEKANLQADGNARLNADFDTAGETDSAYAEICTALSGTPWESKPQDPEWERIMKGELRVQFNTVQHIERQWHCHRNPAPETDAFLAQHNIARA